MRALWAAGPERGKLVTLRAPMVEIASAPNPLVWLAGIELEDRRVENESRMYRATVYAVGDRGWRVLLPTDCPHPEVVALHALIDADPATLAQVEVRV